MPARIQTQQESVECSRRWSRTCRAGVDSWCWLQRELGQQVALLPKGDDLRIALDLRMQCLPPPLGEPVIAPPLVIQRGVWPLAPSSR